MLTLLLDRATVKKFFKFRLWSKNGKKRPAHEVILSKLDESSKGFSGIPESWVRIRLFEGIIILCDVLNEMIIPEKEIVNCQERFRDIYERLKNIEYKLAMEGCIILGDLSSAKDFLEK